MEFNKEGSMRDTAPSFSRSTRPSPFGKRTKDVRTKLAESTKLVLEQTWRELGYMTEADFLAELIELRVHGVEHVQKIHTDRLNAIAGIGQERGDQAARSFGASQRLGQFSKRSN